LILARTGFARQLTTTKPLSIKIFIISTFA
jgi:hypothetical protein